MGGSTSGRAKGRTNEQWVAELSGAELSGEPSSRDGHGGEPENAALEDLRSILERGLRAALAGRLGADIDATTEDFAQDGLLKILKSLESFRGDSSFTTWAQKVAINGAFTELRRQRWRDVSLQDHLEQRGEANAGPEMVASSPQTPEQEATQRATLATVQRLIDEELTERQRRVMVAVVEGMPPEEVARKLGTSRSAVYKTIHDARRRLKKHLEEEGFPLQEALAVFGE